MLHYNQQLGLIFSASVCIFLLVSTWGCGYKFGTNSSTPLPSYMQNIYLQQVENPTNSLWLERNFRSRLKDEMHKHGRIDFANKDSAQGIMRVEIQSSSIGTKLEDQYDETVRSQVNLLLQASIFRKKDHKLVWESGPIDIRESFPGRGREESDPQLRRARTKAVQLGVEELVNRLRQGF